MPKFTHFDLLELSEQEQELKLLLTEKKEEIKFSPKKQTINNILNYSKALSVRKSTNIDYIEMVLN